MANEKRLSLSLSVVKDRLKSIRVHTCSSVVEMFRQSLSANRMKLIDR
jgi:hypothetical protein